MRNTTTFSITQARGAQLRELARLKGTTVTDLIGRWVVSEFDTLGVPSEYAPLEISFSEDGPTTLLRCEFFGGEFETMLTPKEARHLADSIKSILSGVQATMDFDACGAIVQRHGRGLQLIIGTWSKNLAFDVAREIATELAEAAAETYRP